MTLNDTLTMFGGTMGAASVMGFVWGVILIWLPKNIK